ncbi:hypothetical protein [Rhizobacter sp. Root404]|uniref:hypothetical protein n=1 Tax=Rhizobacter sp. Root404 TaxID=1736528 RepID=UPI0012FC0835|nr:hypothetical protein [Rhizobacter sp. Root404]
MRPGPIVLLAALMIGATAAAAADDSNPLGLGMVETPDLRLIYQTPTLDYLLPHTIQTFTNSLRWQRERFGWVPSQPVTVMLKDFSDYGNAGATPMPFNTLRVEVSPASNAFETNPSSERMYSLMNHELVHLATTDIATAADRRWRGLLLGKVPPQPKHPETLLYSYLTVPRFNVPRWLLEGAAVFMETWMGGGLGRAQGGYDEMVFRAMVRDDAPFHDPLGLESRGVRIDFQVGANAYLYGTRFITWLAYAHTPEKVVEWLRRDEGSLRHYADQFQQVFGMPLDTAWREWVTFEREFQRRNLVEVRKQPITPLRALVPVAVGSSSRTYFDEASGVLYGAFRYPGVVEHVGAIDTKTGTVRRLADIKGAMLYSVTSFAYDPAHRTAFFTTDNLAYRDLVALDVVTGKTTPLLKDARIGELVFNAADRSLLGVRHQNGLATIVRIPYPYTEWNQLHTFPYGVVPTDLDVSPDGLRVSASVSEVHGDQFVRVWTLAPLLEGRLEQVSEFRFGQAAPEGFVFSRDGRYLYGSSYYTGASNIFRYEVATGRTDAVTNAETGLFRPVPTDDGRLMVLNFTGQGFVPSVVTPRPLEDVSAVRFLGAELATRHPVVTRWQVPPPSTVDDDKLVTRRGHYAPLQQLQLQSAYPVLQGYKDAVGVGYHANIDDLLGFAHVGITAAYTPDAALKQDERAHVQIDARYLGWRGALSWNRSDFYDLSGPTKRSRKGLAVKLGYDQPLVFDEPRRLDLKLDLAYFDKIDTLPDYQNVSSGFTRLTTASAGLYFTDVRRSLGGVDDEKGVRATGVLSASLAQRRTTPQLRGTVDAGYALPWGHSSVWSRTAFGAASGDRSNPLANFYFGGFGNNRIDDGEVKRYRDYDAMPGFRLNEIAGLSFVRQMVEWNLPPLVFESAGMPAFHATWLRPAVFASALWTDPGRATLRKRYTSIGTQLDLRFSVLHWYEMILSAGVAVGSERGGRTGHEWMVSLKIM